MFVVELNISLAFTPLLCQGQQKLLGTTSHFILPCQYFSHTSSRQWNLIVFSCSAWVCTARIILLYYITSILKQPYLQLSQVQELAYWWHCSCSVSPPSPADPCSNNPAPPSALAGTFGCSPQWNTPSLEPGPRHWKVISPAEKGSGQRKAPQHHEANAAKVLGGHRSSSAADLSETGAIAEPSSWLQKTLSERML